MVSLPREVGGELAMQANVVRFTNDVSVVTLKRRTTATATRCWSGGRGAEERRVVKMEVVGVGS